MTPQSFTDAQQAADTAYAMTLDETGDMAQASADYTAVMGAYYAAQYPDYGPASHQRTIAARYADPRQHEPNQVCLADMMLATGRMDYPEWIEKIWLTLPEIEY